MRLRPRRPIVAALVALACAFLTPVWAGAAEPGVIAGQVVARTAGAPGPAGTEVVLHVHRLSAGSDEHRQTAVGPDGRFRFDGLPTGEDYAYEVTARYGGHEYGGEPLRFEGGQTELEVALPVWETTDRNPGVVVDQLVVFALEADRAAQTLQILEVVTLNNPADRTYVPNPGGPEGPMNLLRFALPAGVWELEPASGLDPSQMVQVDRGFASLAPLPPGRWPVSYTYRVAYDSGAYTFTRPLATGARVVRFLVRPPGVELSSPDLRRQPDSRIGPYSYRVLGGADLPAGARFTVELAGLPTRPFWEAPPGRAPVVPILALGGAAAVAVASLAVVRRRRRAGRATASALAAPIGRPPAQVRVEEVGADGEALLRALAALDERRERGEIPAARHERERAELKRRLMALMRARPAEGIVR